MRALQVADEEPIGAGSSALNGGLAGENARYRVESVNGKTKGVELD